MRTIQPAAIILLSAFMILFTACGGVHHTPENQGGFYYSGIYFGKNFSPALKEGVSDGCETSKGLYSKDHILFNTDIDYNTGWFLGRKRCIPLFKVEENNQSEKVT